MCSNCVQMVTGLISDQVDLFIGCNCYQITDCSCCCYHNHHQQLLSSQELLLNLLHIIPNICIIIFLVAGLETIFYTTFIVTCIIYFHAKFCVHSSYGSLFITNKLKTKYIFHTPAISSFIFYKKLPKQSCMFSEYMLPHIILEECTEWRCRVCTTNCTKLTSSLP